MSAKVEIDCSRHSSVTSDNLGVLGKLSRSLASFRSPRDCSTRTCSQDQSGANGRGLKGDTSTIPIKMSKGPKTDKLKVRCVPFSVSCCTVHGVEFE